MKLTYLREFIKAAYCQDMRQASQELNISPSVLSKHLSSLEEELGAPLFVSSKKNVLTLYGETMLPYAEEIIKMEEDYFARRESEKKTTSTLTIAMTPIQTREISGRIVENFSYSNPGVRIKTVELGNSEIVNYVKEGKCDFAFYRSQSEFYRDDSLSSIPVSTSAAVVYISESNPLSQKEGLTWEDIAGETIYLRNENSTIYKVCMREYQKLGIEPKIEFVGEHSVYENIKNGKGITIYLSTLINTEYNSSIKIIPLSPKLTSYIDLIFRKESLSPVKAQFLEYAFHTFIISL